MSQDICPRCGNPIPDWAQGGCPVCRRIEQEKVRFGRGGSFPGRSVPPSGSQRTRRAKQTRPRIRPRPVQSRPDRGFWGRENPGTIPPGFRARLEGFNAFLEDVYARPVRISHILAQGGISQEQIAIWRQDALWLLLFMHKLETRLATALTAALPGADAGILSAWYGFGRECSMQTIRQSRSAPKCRAEQRRVVAFLRCALGRAMLEQIMVDSAREIMQKVE